MKVLAIESEDLPLRGQFFFIAGATCVVSTNSQSVIDSLSPWGCPHRQPFERSFELNVLVDPSAARTLGAAPHFRGLHHLVFAAFGERELFVFDLLRRSVTGVVSKATAEDDLFWKNLLLPIALGVMGATIGLVPVHAACLDRNGRGLMIAGPSGAGKSTLAVTLSQREFSLVSDDWTYIAQERGQITAYGISAPVKLLADAPHLFPELSRFQPSRSLNGEMAFEVDPARVFGSRVRSESTPSWLIFLERREQAGCQLLPCSRKGTRTFFENSAERLPNQLREVAAKRSEAIAALAKQECWLLRYGGPPQVAAEAISGFCERM
jgi:HPr Serine kinase C-terminal domain